MTELSDFLPAACTRDTVARVRLLARLPKP